MELSRAEYFNPLHLSAKLKQLHSAISTSTGRPMHKYTASHL